MRFWSVLLPVTDDCPPRLRALTRVLAAAMCVGLLLHAVLAVTAGSGSLLKGWVYTVDILLAGVLCGVRAIAVRRDRAIWALLCAAVLTSSMGNVLYYGVIYSMSPQPYPSVADACWMLFYPPSYAALALLVSRHLRHLPRSTWLDGGIGALALGALGTGVVLPSIVRSVAGSRPIEVATALSYPSADLLLLMTVVVTVALSGWRPGSAWALIGLGLAVTAVADVVYCVRVATETYADGTLLDSAWPAGMLLLGFAAWQPPRPIRGRLEGATALAVPYAFTCLVLGLLVVDHFRRLDAVSTYLAAATVVLAGYRTLRTYTELRDLGDSRRLALTDDLTGLGNRRDLQRRLAALTPAEQAEPAALLLIDLDRFKDLNDTLGHAAGDQLLEHVADRLRESVPADAAVCRLGGDEFAVVIGVDEQAALDAARAIRAALQRPLRLHGTNLLVDGSVGVACFPADAATGQELLQRADVAMYAAKRAGSGAERYDSALDGHSRERLALLGDLPSAIAGNQLVLHYQPQIDLADGRVIAVEALVRWHHPRRGLLAPGAFLPAAERTDLMRPLTLWVLDRAVQQAAAWRALGHDLAVAVNVAVDDLVDAAFPAAVAAALARHDLPPAGLRLELTENIVLIEDQRMSAVLAGLSELGVALSLDDFGTGQSSLAHLKRLAVDELKIDRSFVTNMGTDARDCAIVRATIGLGRELGLTVVAEGVEDEATLDNLTDMGCDLAQGYHVSRPVPPDALEALLRRDPAGRAV